jgi:hypothetical protein
MTNTGISLVSAIEQLRSDLYDVAAAGWKKELAFKLSPIELTLHVEVVKDKNGKLGWKIVEAGGSITRTNAQTLTIRLEPLWRTSDGAYTSEFIVSDSTDEPVAIA